MDDGEVIVALTDNARLLGVLMKSPAYLMTSSRLQTVFGLAQSITAIIKRMSVILSIISIQEA